MYATDLAWIVYSVVLICAALFMLWFASRVTPREVNEHGEECLALVDLSGCLLSDLQHY